MRTVTDRLAAVTASGADIADAGERMLVALGALRATSLAGRTACCLDGLALAILGLQAVLAGRDTLLCTHSWYTCDSPRTAGRQQDTHAAKSVKAKQTKQADRHFEVFERGSATA